MTKGKVVSKEEMARMLDGYEYECEYELPVNMCKIARDSGLVIVYGEPNDDSLIILEGAVRGEADLWRGGSIAFDGEAITEYQRDDYYPNFENIIDGWPHIESIYSDLPGEPTWVYDTDIPCSRFNLMENGAVYCVGIVFHVNDIGGNHEN